MGMPECRGRTINLARGSKPSGRSSPRERLKAIDSGDWNPSPAGRGIPMTLSGSRGLHSSWITSGSMGIPEYRAPSVLLVSIWARGFRRSVRSSTRDPLPTTDDGGWRPSPAGVGILSWSNGRGFAHLADYVRVHGNARVPSGGSFQGFELGQWVSRQRAAQSKGELSTDRIARLESLSGWAWNEIAARWEEGFNHLLAYVAERGTSRVPFGYRSPDGMRLGQWINMQRNAYAAGTLADDRRERLEHLTGWTWNARLQLWEDGYAALCRYVQQTGSASVPYDGVFEGFTLGKWVTTQRRAYTAGKLKERQERLLRLPGWVWDAIDEQWEAGFIHLLKWVESTGSSAKLPRNYLDATDGYGLGNWVAVQRQFFKRANSIPLAENALSQFRIGLGTRSQTPGT